MTCTNILYTKQQIQHVYRALIIHEITTVNNKTFEAENFHDLLGFTHNVWKT